MLIVPMDLSAKLDIRPPVEDAKKLFEQTREATPRPTLLPVCITLPADLLTPSAIYLKLSEGCVHLLPPIGLWLTLPQVNRRVLVPPRERHRQHRDGRPLQLHRRE